MENSPGGQRWGCRPLSRPCASFSPPCPPPSLCEQIGGRAWARCEQGARPWNFPGAEASSGSRPVSHRHPPPSRKEGEAGSGKPHTSPTFPTAACLPVLSPSTHKHKYTLHLGAGKVHSLPPGGMSQPGGEITPTSLCGQPGPGHHTPPSWGPRAPQPTVYLHFKATQCGRSGQGWGRLGEAA